MKTVKNENTGKMEVQFTAKLVKINPEVRKNSKGTEFMLATVEFEDLNGKVQKTLASIYMKNYSYGMEIGENYLATASQDENGNVYIHISHLSNTPKATADMFGFGSTEVTKVTASDFIEE